MALPIVQLTASLRTAAATNPVVLTFPASPPPIAGDTIAFIVIWPGVLANYNLAGNPTDNAGNVYLPVQPQQSSTAIANIATFQATNIALPANGPIQITVNFTNPTFNTLLVAIELTSLGTLVGIDLLGNVNTNAPNPAWANKATATPAVNLNLLSQQAFVVAALFSDTISTLTANAGWTMVTSTVRGQGVFYMTSSLAPPSQQTLCPATFSQSSTGLMVAFAFVFSPVISPVPVAQLSSMRNAHYIPQGLLWLRPFGDNWAAAASDVGWLGPCAGIAVRCHWSDLNPAAGVFDFSYLDKIFAYAQQCGKIVSLNITTGIYSPAWLFTLGCQVLTITTQPGNCAPPWDPIYLQYWGAFQKALGARYGSNPLLSYNILDGLGFGNGQADLCTACSDNAQMLAAAQAGGFPTDDFVTKCNAPAGVAIWKWAVTQIAAIYQAAFPGLPMIITKGAPVYPKQSQGYFDALNDLYATYGSGYNSPVGLKDNALDDNWLATQPMGNTMIAKSPPGISGFQRNHPATDPNEWAASMTLALSLNAWFIEIYDGEQTVVTNDQLSHYNYLFMQQAAKFAQPPKVPPFSSTPIVPIKVPSLLDYCNPAMKADRTFKAMAEALDPQLHEILSLIPVNQIISNLNNQPEAVIDFLAAYHFNTPYYNQSFDLVTKRRLVINTILNYLPFGTASAVKGVLSIAFNYAEVIEWWQDNPPAPHDTFRIQIADPLVDPVKVSEMIRAILTVKNVRSWFAGISSFSSMIAPLKIGCAIGTYKYQVIRAH
jgi:phage tail P2-like protein